MKARVKATGKIKEVAQGIYYPYQYVDNEGTIYTENDIEELPGDDDVIFIDPTLDYWTRLEHQAAIGAMQAYIIASHISQFSFYEGDMKDCRSMAHALVQKLKEKEERK